MPEPARNVSQALIEAEVLNETPTVNISQAVLEVEVLNDTPTVNISQVVLEVEILLPSPPIFRHGIETHIYVHNVNMSPYVEAMSMEISYKTRAIKRLGAASVERIRSVNMDTLLMLAGMYHSGGMEEKIWNMLQNATYGCWAFLLEGDIIGQPVYLGKVIVASEQVEAGDSAVKMPVQAFGGDATYRGIILQPLLTWDTDGSYTVHDNAAGSDQGGIGYLICTAISATGATLVVKIEHSADNVNWSALCTFANVTSAGGATSEKVIADVGIYRYLKVSRTITAGKEATFFVGWYEYPDSGIGPG